MKKRLLLPLALSTSMGYSPSVFAELVLEASDNTEEITIIGIRDNRSSKGATGLNLDIKDTPQSISLVSRELMENFSANNLNDALKLATGIQVEEWETNRTNYTARGFDIKNTQIDGIGMPNDWGIVTGQMDSFAYDKLEIIRGANGLLTGVGNSSGTINYVRKRPTNIEEGSVGLSAGSFNFKRIEADYSTPLNDEKSWAGRIVFASEDKDSYLRGYENNRTLLYGVFDGQLTENSTLTFGASHQDNHSKGNFWGALVLAYSDGTQADFPRNSSTSQNWTMWDTTDNTAFAEYVYNWSPNWNSKVSYNYRSTENEDKLFYVYSGATGIDKKTGLGLYGWPGNWPDKSSAHLVDVSLSGEFELFERKHQLIVGASHANSDYYSYQKPADSNEPAFGSMPAFPFSGDEVPEPVWGNKVLRSSSFQTLDRMYGCIKFELTDKLNSIVGFNDAKYHRDGDSYAVPFDQTEHKLSPYIGLTYKITDKTLAYVSYSDIYQPQDQQTIQRTYVDPSQGVNYEMGVKTEITPRVLATAATFKAEQNGLATFAGIDNGTWYYSGVDVYSKGTEFEIVGKITSSDNLTLGLTSLKVEDKNGNAIYPWVPRQTVNLAYSTKLSTLPSVSMGLSAKYQSNISRVDDTTSVVLHQSSYVTLNAFAAWNVTQQWEAQLNINNLTNEKSLTSLYNVGFYSAPTNATASIKFKF